MMSLCNCGGYLRLACSSCLAFYGETLRENSWGSLRIGQGQLPKFRLVVVPWQPGKS